MCIRDRYIATELIRSISIDSAGVEAFMDSTKILNEIELLMGGQGGQNILEGRQNDLGEDLKLSMKCWKPTYTSTPLTKDIFPFQHRQNLLNLFINYNTPLPLSLAVERIYSIGGDIFIAKRSALTAFNFEHLIFLKGNMDLLSFEDDIEDCLLYT